MKLDALTASFRNQCHVGKLLYGIVCIDFCFFKMSLRCDKILWNSSEKLDYVGTWKREHSEQSCKNKLVLIRKLDFSLRDLRI